MMTPVATSGPSFEHDDGKKGQLTCLCSSSVRLIWGNHTTHSNHPLDGLLAQVSRFVRGESSCEELKLSLPIPSHLGGRIEWKGHSLSVASFLGIERNSIVPQPVLAQYITLRRRTFQPRQPKTEIHHKTWK